MEFCKVTFESVDEILRCDHSNESSLPALSHSAICFSKVYKMKFTKLLEICLWLLLAVKGLRHPRHQRESKTVLDSGFQAVDSGFFFSVELGFRIPWAEFRIPQFWNVRITLHGAIRLLSCIFLLCCSFYYAVFIRLNTADGSNITNKRRT